MYYKKPIKTLVFLYKKTLSPDSGVFRVWYDSKTPTCVFYPTCSVYFEKTIAKNGFIKGFLKGVYRILRCHPWQKTHIDLP